MFAGRNSLLTLPPLPSYLSAGAGGTGASSPVTFSNTAPTNADCSLIWAVYANTAATPTIGCTFGSTSATLVTSGTVAITTATPFYYISCFYILWSTGPLSGSQTVSFTDSGTGMNCATNVIHYTGVSSVGTAVSVGNQSGQPTMSASSTNPSTLYTQCFGYRHAATGNTFSAYTGATQRYLIAATVGTNGPMVIGDAPGNGGTLTISATRSNTTNAYGGMIVPLLAA